MVATLYVVLVTKSSTWQGVFGGSSIGTVLGVFCYSQLQTVRISQIALALFESYVTELRTSLLQSEGIRDEGERQEARLNAWQRFRIGLNDLWLREDARQKVLTEHRKIEKKKMSRDA